MNRVVATYRLALLAILLLVASGCSSGVGWPNFWHPGPAGYQRHNALYHDPYPVDDMGPEMVGARPRSYQRPIPEPVRAQPFAPPPIRAGYPWQ